MKKFPSLLVGLGLTFATAETLPADEIISVNFWRQGGGAHDWEPGLTLTPEQTAGFGDWATTGWQNYELPWAPTSPRTPVTLTGTDGSTATFVLKDTRNGGPYIWNTPRTTLLGDGNGNMMDGHANSTEDPGDGSNIFEIEVTEIPFEIFDLVFYLGVNRDQFGDGTGKFTINGGPEEDFTLPSGAFTGTFTEITNAETPGNYLVVKGLTGTSFTAKVWGNGFNHIGPHGLQIVESNEARQPLEIANVSHNQTTDQITLTWKSNPGDTYGIYWSEDLINFVPGINPAVSAHAEESVTTFGPFPNPKPNATRLFFRIGPPDLEAPVLERTWGVNQTITLDFSEPLELSTATDPSNFTVTADDGGTVSISSIQPGEIPDTLVLTTDTPLSTATGFSVAFNNLTDLAARPVTGPTTANIKTWDNNPDGIKVFILAGQSNMQGHGRNEIGNGNISGAVGSLRYQVDKDPANYGHLVDEDQNWIPKPDVKVFWRDSELDAARSVKKGDLLPTFGVDDGRFGPEYGFGWAIDDYFDEPVLIVKTCWGGKSLYADFRPPSAVAKRGGEVGPYYTGMFDYLHDILDNLDTEFPAWAGQGYQIAGFGWHQGWNDGGTEFTASQYEANLADLIRDLRSEFGNPSLPVSIANTGIGGNTTTGDRLTLLLGQLTVANPVLYPEFSGTVSAIDTRPFWRPGVISPVDQDFHWNQNGETYFLIGSAMGQGMKNLLNAGGE